MRVFGAFLLLVATPAFAQVAVERIDFPSRDSKTQLIGYVFKAEGAPAKAPAVVMMPGISGAYTPLANGRYDASTLSPRHKAWGRFWASRGYVVLLVDEFSAVGHPAGFNGANIKAMSAELEEVFNRPLHAYGALRYLQSRPDVDPRRVALMGWSGGASSVLAAMADNKPGDMRAIGFRVAAALYPSCRLKGQFDKKGYSSYAPVQIFIGTGDKVMSVARCQAFVEQSKGGLRINTYPGATHSYDAPIASIQNIPGNAEAKQDSEAKIEAFFREALAKR